MKYLVVADFIGSRLLNEKKFYNLINEISIDVNHKFKLAVPLMITLGDSFQLVCSNRNQAVEIIKYIDLKTESQGLFRYVVCTWPNKTDKINTITRFDFFAKKGGAYINPLICDRFKQAMAILDKKYNGIVFLD